MLLIWIIIFIHLLSLFCPDHAEFFASCVSTAGSEPQWQCQGALHTAPWCPEWGSVCLHCGEHHGSPEAAWHTDIHLEISWRLHAGEGWLQDPLALLCIPYDLTLQEVRKMNCGLVLVSSAQIFWTFLAGFLALSSHLPNNLNSSFDITVLNRSVKEHLLQISTV